MPLIIVAVGIVLLFLLISVFRIHAFLALLVTSFAVGILGHMEPVKVLQSITSGIGSTMGSLALIITFGAMLGKLIEDSGAAYRITNGLIRLFGEKYIHLAIVITSFVVGLPMIYNAGFLVLIPLIYTLSTATKQPLIYLGLPMCAALSVTHGFLPPHPAPTSIAFIYNANVSMTLLYGIIVAIPAILAGGPLLARFYKNIQTAPPKELYEPKEFNEDDLPSMRVSLLMALSPVVFILAGALAGLFLPSDSSLLKQIKFLGDPTVALFLSVFISVFLLGIRQKYKMSRLMNLLSVSVGAVTMILLIIASGGAFKQVLTDCGAGEYIKQVFMGFNFSPLLMAFALAALLRLAIGSATVACITAAGMISPLVKASGVSPELMVIATGAGSLMFSHFNDIGFWMFKEYFNTSVKQTFAIWTVMETIVGVVGIAGVLLLNMVV